MKFVTAFICIFLVTSCGMTPKKIDPKTGFFPQSKNAPVSFKEIIKPTSKGFSSVRIRAIPDKYIAESIQKSFKDLVKDSFQQMGFQSVCLTEEFCNGAKSPLGVTIRYGNPMQGKQYERRVELDIYDEFGRHIFHASGEKSVMMSDEKELIYPAINRAFMWLNFNNLIQKP